MRILLVDDDEALMESLAQRLIQQRYAVDIAIDGGSAHAYLDLFNYDLIVLDLMLPDGDGIAFCRQFRQSGYVNPLMILTAKASTSEKVNALDAGADDYVIKPFDFDELCARIRALLRREHEGLPTVLEWGALQFDPGLCELTYAQQLVRLTPKELSLIELFLRHPHQVHSLSGIMDDLWSLEAPPGEDAIRTHIKSLRRKLREAGAPKDLIKTVYGLGYRLNENTANVKPSIQQAEQKTKRDRITPNRNQSNNTHPSPLSQQNNKHFPNQAANPDKDPFGKDQIDKGSFEKGQADKKQQPSYQTNEDPHYKRRQSANLAPTAQQQPIRKEITDPDQSLAAALSPATCRYLQNAQQLISEIEKVAVPLPVAPSDNQLRANPLPQAHSQQMRQNAQKQAQMNAHKLAGSLGSFGLAKGSQLAQQIEFHLSASSQELARTDHPSQKKPPATEPTLSTKAIPEPSESYSEPEVITQLIQQLHRYIDVATQQACTLPTPQLPSTSHTDTIEEDTAASLLIVSKNDALIHKLTQAAHYNALPIQVFSHLSVPLQNELALPATDLVIWDTNSVATLPSMLVSANKAQEQHTPLPHIIALANTMTLTEQRRLVAQGAKRVMDAKAFPTDIMQAANDVLSNAKQAAIMRVAIADDDPDFLEHLNAHLAPSAFTVSTFTSAQALWQWLHPEPPSTNRDMADESATDDGIANGGIADRNRQDNFLKADLLILDIEMPGMSGLELCQILRADIRFQHLPIIFLTIRNDEATRNQAFEAGANDFISKADVTPKELAHRIQNRRYTKLGGQ